MKVQQEYIEASGIDISFGNRHLLKNVYIRLDPACVTGLLGRNGTGKTTLLNIIYGIRAADSGMVRFSGESADKEVFRISRCLGFLPQKRFLPENIPVAKLFQLYEADFQFVTDFFPEFRDLYKVTTRNFSRGQSRFLEVVLVLSSACPFIILDEPFSAIMPSKVATLKAMIQVLGKSKSILITDHLYRDIIEISDRILLLGNDASLTELKDPIPDLISRGYLPPGR